MSYELYTDNDKYLGSLATNKGLDDLRHFVSKSGYITLTKLCNSGTSEDVVGLIEETADALQHGTPSADVANTLKGLKVMLQRAGDTVIITG